MKYPKKIIDLDIESILSNDASNLQKEAIIFLRKQKWCRNIQKGWLFTDITDLLSIYLFEIENSQVQEEYDNWIWVIVGDFPPMYLDIFCTTNKEALEAYIDLAENWITSFDNGSIEKDMNYPFELYVSSQNFELFRKKVKGLKGIIYEQINEIDISVVR